MAMTKEEIELEVGKAGVRFGELNSFLYAAAQVGSDDAVKLYKQFVDGWLSAKQDVKNQFNIAK